MTIDTIAHRTAPDDLAFQLPDLIEPRWWTGTPAIDPALFSIDCGGEVTPADLRPDSALAERMQATFDSVGLVHVVGTGLTDVAAMRELATLVVDSQMAYAGGSNPRDRMGPNVYEVGAPLSAWLHYHHEMA